MLTPTDRQGEYSAICLYEYWKIEGRDLHYHRDEVFKVKHSGAIVDLVHHVLNLFQYEPIDRCNPYNLCNPWPSCF